MRQFRLRRLVFAAIAAHAYGGGTFLRRPLLTGCLQACGVDDMVCVTSCQVCVERYHCRRVATDCETCAELIAQRAALHTRRAESRASAVPDTDADLVLDGGGTPMLRDGVRTLLSRAQGEELYSRRHLRSAREDVLQAQHQAEWAHSQRLDEVSELHDAKQALQDARDELVKWRLGTRRKLKDLKSEPDDGRNASTRSTETPWRSFKDRKWVERGLREEIAKERQDVQDTIADHRLSRLAERLARRALKDAKRRFLNLASKYHKSQRRVQRLVRKVRQLSTKLNSNSVAPGSDEGGNAAANSLAPAKSRASAGISRRSFLLLGLAVVAFGSSI